MFVLAGALLACLFWAQPAGAAEPCLSFSHAIEENDGSVVATGGDCIARFDPSGNLDPAFGTGGSSPLDVGNDSSSPPYHRPDGEYVVALLEVDTGYLVVTDTALIRFKSDGSRDPSFGEDGRIDTNDLVPGIHGTSEAVIAQDESIFLTGVVMTRGVVVKLKPTGELDDAFGESGIYMEPSGPDFRFDFQQLALPEDGKVLVAGGRGDDSGILSAVVMRLTADGDVDEAFGEDGLSTTPDLTAGRGCPLGCYVGLNQMTVAGDGGITLMGYMDFVSLKGSDREPTWARISDSGVPGAIAGLSFAGFPLVEFSDGDFAVTGYAGGRLHPDGSGGFADGHAYTKLNASPGGFRGSAISFNPVTGHLVSSGRLVGETGEWCPYSACFDEMGAIAKIDATTGEPIAGFGSNGVAVPRTNKCAFGFADQGAANGSWKRCRIMPPDLFGKVKIRRGASRKPFFETWLTFNSVPRVPKFAGQRLSLRIPDRLRLKKGFRKGAFRISTNAAAEGTFRTSLKGRTLTVSYVPDQVTVDPDYEEVPANQPIGVKIRSRRGTVKPIPKHRRKTKLNFEVKGALFAGTKDTAPWWGESAGRKIVRARPVAIKK